MRLILATLVYAALLTTALAQPLDEDRFPGWHNRMTGYQVAKEPRWDVPMYRSSKRHLKPKHARRSPAKRLRAPHRAYVAGTTLAYGFTREIAYAAGFPDSLGSTGRGVVIGGRPAGCPARFCGCGASLHLFGRIIPSLNLAANWLRFPRTLPAANMVAARRGHVFVLKQHIAGSTWIVHDSNSGGRRTRLHARSIAGYVIVNPG